MKLKEILNELEKDLPNTIYTDKDCDTRFKTKKEAYLIGKRNQLVKVNAVLEGRELQTDKGMNLFCKQFFGLPGIIWFGLIWFVFGFFINSTGNMILGAVMLIGGIIEIFYLKLKKQIQELKQLQEKE